jgi:hypothetical protein
MLLLWLVVGIYAGPVSYLVIAGCMLLMYRKAMYEELLIGYIFILILSDSLEDQLLFAKAAKNIYISLLAGFFFLDTGRFNPLHQLYKIFMPFFLFSVITMMCSFNDSFFFTSVQKTLSYFLTFLVIPNLVLYVYRERGSDFFRSLLFFLLLTLVAGIVLRFVAHDIAYIENGRFRGVLGNPNGLGIYCLMIFMFFFVISDRYPEMFNRLDKLIFYVLILGSIMLTDSRNAILAVAIFLVFQRFFTISPFLGLIFFIGFLVVAEAVSANLSRIVIYLGIGEYFRVETLEEGSGRYIAWDFAWKQIQENFFVGKGFAYNEFYMRQHYGFLNKLGHQGGIHNSFLTFWMDQGLLGLIIYLRSYILMFVLAAKHTRFAYPILFALSFTAIFESWMVGSLSVFALMAMLIYTVVTSEEIMVTENAFDEEEKLNTQPLLN